MKTSTQIKVRGYHLDGYRHVNNARYLEFMEEARWDYLDRIHALDYFRDSNLAFVIVNINIDYKYPARQGETLTITTWLAEAGNTSFVFRQELFNEEQQKLSAAATVTFVLLDQASGRPVRVSEEARTLLSGASPPQVAQ